MNQRILGGVPLLQTTERPDLSALPQETQVNALMAETQGAGWYTWATVPGGVYLIGDDPVFPLLELRPDGSHILERVPDYLNDESLLGGVIARERLALVPSEDGWYALQVEDVVHDYGHASRNYTLSVIGTEWLAKTPGLAVAHATLSKHLIPWPKDVAETAGVLG